MNKIFQTFFVFFLIFGMIGGVFGTLTPGGSSSTVSQSSNLNLEINFPVIVTFNKKILISGNSDKVWKVENDFDYALLMKQRYDDPTISLVSAKDKDNKDIKSIFYITNSDSNSGIIDGTYYADFRKKCVENPQTCSNDILSTINSAPSNAKRGNNDKDATNVVKNLINYLKSTQNAFDDCIKTNKDCKLEKNNLDQINNLILKRNDLNLILITMDDTERKMFIDSYNKNECKDSWIESLCTLFSSTKVKDLAVNNYLKQVNDLNDQKLILVDRNHPLNGPLKDLNKAELNLNDCKIKKCDSSMILLLENDLKSAKEEYNKAYNKELTNLAFQGTSLDSVTDCDSEGFTDACMISIKKLCDNPKNKEECDIILPLANEGYKKTIVKTNGLYSVLSILSNPDSDALNAAKYFGFEPDYKNIPALLKDSLASQVCSRKIDGYLDKDRNDNGGVTTYGCTESYGQNYDPNIGQQVITGDPNCINILVDLRAKRTQITPDNKVSISYSLYLKAPTNIDIKYFMAISYHLTDGTIKHELLYPDVLYTNITQGAIKIDAQTVNFPLNISRENIIDSATSFSLTLRSEFITGGVYHQKSIPIILVTDSTYYNSILNDGTNSSNTNSNPNPQSPTVTPQDLLNLIS